MTPEAQRIAIAEACGWVGAHYPNDKWRPMRGFFQGKLGIVPDYLNDLNAMHEAEKILSDDQWSYYCVALNALCCSIKCGGDNRMCGYTVHATATQRAEAFLKAIEKWT